MRQFLASGVDNLKQTMAYVGKMRGGPCGMQLPRLRLRQKMERAGINDVQVHEKMKHAARANVDDDEQQAWFESRKMERVVDGFS